MVSENGQKKSKKNYKNGKKYGVWIKWYENGMKGGEEIIKTIIEMDYFIDGTKMDKKRLKELTRMG